MLKFINSFYKLGEEFYSKTSIESLSDPKLVHFNKGLYESIGGKEISSDDIVKYFSGQKNIAGSEIYSTCYAGHQFGSYVASLGDGRAHFLGEVVNQKGESFELQFKGSGKTDYSRFGDGKAVLRSSLREYLASEALHNLGIPTTRALSLTTGSGDVEREFLEKEAMVMRVSPSFIRFGHFEYFTHRGEFDNVKKLADYAIDKFFPDISDEDEEQKYRKFYYEIVSRTAKLIAKWQAYGFVHGVMNTDNMSILGYTIDYGPYGFMDNFDPSYNPNGSDYQGRYSFCNQPSIGLWNLQALAYAFEPLLKIDKLFDILDLYKDILYKEYDHIMRTRLGLSKAVAGDGTLIKKLLDILHAQDVDYTIFFRLISSFNIEGNNTDIYNLFSNKNEFVKWEKLYIERIKKESWFELNKDMKEFLLNRSIVMKKHNPKYILRNYMMENAILLAQESGDYSEVEKLFNILKNPFDDQPEFENYSSIPPDWSKSICLTCSS